MLNLGGLEALTFGRPFSILAAAGERVSFLYRVVGRFTGLLATMGPGMRLSYFGPLGTPFPPPPADRAVLLLAGGVGLPPLQIWWVRHGRPQDRAFFGGRDGADVPWSLIPEAWEVSVERSDGLPEGREPFVGLVTDLCRARLDVEPGGPYLLYACGPTPMLRGAAALAAERGWPCLVSVEEHMGCGYGVCRGCAVPLAGGGHGLACQDGPVLDAAQVDWKRFDRSGGET
jgi:dihydroorotate dehydrogenase electron transfer subunit